MRIVPHARSARMTRQQRQGTAAVECAICLPVIVTIMFATLELCSGMFLRETLTVAAYEGCRVGIRRRATRQDIFDECNSVLAARGVTGATVTVTPDDFAGILALTPITVTVSAPTNDNSMFVYNLMSGRNPAATVTMVREFDE